MFFNVQDKNNIIPSIIHHSFIHGGVDLPLDIYRSQVYKYILSLKSVDRRESIGSDDGGDSRASVGKRGNVTLLLDCNLFGPPL